MGTSDATVRDLESSICDIQKQVGDIETLLNQKQTSLKYDLERFEAAKSRYQLNRQNLDHTRHKADFVVLKEYREISRLTEESGVEFQDLRAKVVSLEGTIDHLRRSLEKLSQQMSETRRELSIAGAVLKFPSGEPL